MKYLALVLAVIFFAVAGLYATGHFPGTGHQHHMKHALALTLLGILSLVWMRVQTAPSSTASL